MWINASDYSACSEKDDSCSLSKFGPLLPRIATACGKGDTVLNAVPHILSFPTIIQNTCAVFCFSAGKGLPQEMSEYSQKETKMGVEIRSMSRNFLTIFPVAHQPDNQKFRIKTKIIIETLWGLLTYQLSQICWHETAGGAEALNKWTLLMRFTRALDLSSCWLHLSPAPGMNILVSYHISLSCGPAGQLELLHLCVRAFNSKMCFIRFICAITSIV